jgi:hypothetical protein
MRAKTLTNFDFRDEAGRPLHLLGLRENQALTLAVIRAWAMEALRHAGFAEEFDRDVDRLLIRAIAGDQAEIQLAHSHLENAQSGSPIAALRDDVPFADVLNRLATSFVIFRLDDAPPATRRLAKFAYDERLTLRYSSSGYIGHPDGEYPIRADGGPAYLGGKRLSLWDLVKGGHPRKVSEDMPFMGRQRLSMMNRWDTLKDHWRAWGAGIGWRPTVIRFPVPGAELATSFHVELAVPRDISLVRASILAGRPPVKTPVRSTTRLERCANRRSGPTRDLVRPHWSVRRPRPSFDDVGGGFSRVGLHVADVPYGSLSRAQIKVQPDTSGWWAGAVLACVLSTVAQLAALVAARHLRSGPTEARHDIAATVLVTLAAGILAMVTQRDSHRMATRLLRWVRPLVLISTLSLVAASAIFGLHSQRAHFFLELGIAFAVSAVVTLVVAGGWVRAKVRLMGDFEDESPWEHHWQAPTEPVNEPEHLAKARTFDAEARQGIAYELAASWLGFDRPAIRIAGQEQVRETFHWDDGFSEIIDCRLHCALERLRTHPYGDSNQPGSDG